MTTKVKTKPKQIDKVVVGGFVNELMAALAFASPAIAQEVTRPYLCGVRIDFIPGHVAIVATDGHRLHCTKIEGNWAGDTGRAAFVPHKTVKAIIKAFYSVKAQRGGTKHGSFLTWSLDYSTGTLKIGAQTFGCEEAQLDWQRVIPRDPQLFASFHSVHAQHICDAAQAVDAPVKFSIDNSVPENKLCLSAKRHSSQSKSAPKDNVLRMHALVDAVVGAATHDTAFNPRYLKHAFAVLGTGIYMYQEGYGCPAKFTAGDSNQFVVLMPMRV